MTGSKSARSARGSRPTVSMASTRWRAKRSSLASSGTKKRHPAVQTITASATAVSVSSPLEACTNPSRAGGLPAAAASAGAIKASRRGARAVPRLRIFLVTIMARGRAPFPRLEGIQPGCPKDLSATKGQPWTVFCLFRESQLVQVINEGAHGAVHALELRVFRLDDVVFIRSVRAATVAEAEVTCRQVQRLTGEYVTRPGAGVARQNHRVNSPSAIDCGLCPNHRGVSGRAGGIIAATHMDFNIAETPLREVRLERGERRGCRHIGHEPQIELGHRPTGKDRLPARPGVATNEALDVDCGPRHQQLQRLAPAHVMHPVVNAEQLFGRPFVEAACCFGNHRFLGCRERPRLLGEALDGGIVPIGRNQCRKRLHEVPRRTVHPRLVARVDVAARSATPPLAINSSSMTPLAPSVRVTAPSSPCDAEGTKIPTQRPSAAWTSGRCTTCGKCGEPISSSPSATHTRFTGSFRPAPRMAWSAARNAASGPFWFTAPRPTTTFPSPGFSTSAASQGGEDHSDGFTCFTSYMK